MSGPAVLLVATFDDGQHAHAVLRKRALERLGCVVSIVDLQRRSGLLGRWGGGDLASRVSKAYDQAMPDLVLMIGGDELDATAVTHIRTGRTGKWVNWIPWDLRGIERAIAVAGAYDHVFAPGTDVAARLSTDLGREVSVLPFACDPSVYRPVRSRDQYRANVVFAGTASPGREALLSRVLEYGLAIWGPGWRRTSLRDYCRGEMLATEEFVKAYGGASVAVNIHREANGFTEQETTCNQRLFELAAIGIPQVVDHRADLSRFFDPSSECLVYDDADELRAQVGAALLDLPSAEDMAERARATVLGGHTYMHRLRDLLRAVGMDPAN